MKASPRRRAPLRPVPHRLIPPRLAALALAVCCALIAQGAPAEPPPGAPVRKSAAELGLEPHWIEGTPAFPGLPEAIHAYRQAKNEIRVLHVGAHPDDEHSGMMAWLARTKGYRVAYLSATRGEGGQNSIGPETGELLGALRTEELLAARRIDGGEQRFLDLPDFGFSKTSEETLRIWDYAGAERRLVAEIRDFRPQYIVSVFLGDPTDGHGHHQAMGLLCREAFAKAADPNFITPREPWRADALLVSRWRPVENPDPATIRSINLGVHDPVYGLSAWQIAARGRSMHRSQDMGALQPYGPQSMQLQLIELAEGVDAATVWDVFSETTPVAELPDRDALLALWDEYALEPEAHRDGLQRVQRALWELEGPMVELLSPKLELVRDEEIELTLKVTATRGSVVSRKAELVESTPSGMRTLVDEWGGRPMYFTTTRELTDWAGRIVADGAVGSETVISKVGPAVNSHSARDWNARRNPDYLASPDSLARGLPRRANTLHSERYAFRTESFAPLALVEFSRPEGGFPALLCAARATSASLDPRLGERKSPAQSAPRVSLALEPRLLITPLGKNVERGLRIAAEAIGEAAPETRVRVSPRGERPLIKYASPHPSRFSPPGPKLEAHDIGLALGDLASPRDIIAQIENFHGDEPASWDLNASVFWPMVLGPDADEAFRREVEEGTRWGYTPESTLLSRIDYEHIPVRLITQASSLRVVRVDAQLPPNLRVAYVVDADDGMSGVLRQLGANVTDVPRADLATVDWSAFDTVLLGPRAYELMPELVAANARLMDWVRTGGTLVVQYNKYDMQEQGVAPYPFQFSRPHDRITDETAPVEFLQPDAAILSYPNKIGPADFDGWFQERSLYGFGSFDEAQYVPILAAADPGEEPQRGMLLEAKVGEGTWIYCALALHRQAPEGVPGGIRLLANLASQGRWKPSKHVPAAMPID